MKKLTDIVNETTAVHCPTWEETRMFLTLVVSNNISLGSENFDTLSKYPNQAFGEANCFSIRNDGKVMYGHHERFSTEGAKIISVFQLFALLKGPSENQQEIIDAVLGERQRQNHKHGMPNLEPVVWMAILTEEVGEVSKEAVDLKFDSPTDGLKGLRLANYRKELIEVAAMCFKMIECLDAGMLGQEGGEQ